MLVRREFARRLTTLVLVGPKLDMNYLKVTPTAFRVVPTDIFVSLNRCLAKGTAP